MKILITVKIDRQQLPYWSAMLMDNKTVVLETVSKTFNPAKKKDAREYFENVAVRMIKEIDSLAEDTRQHVLRSLITEPVETDNNPGGVIIPGIHKLKRS